MQHNLNLYANRWDCLKDSLCERIKGHDSISVRLNPVMNISLLEAADQVVDCFRKQGGCAWIDGFDHDDLYIHANYGTDECVGWVCSNGVQSPIDVRTRVFGVYLFGSKDLVLKVFSTLTKKYESNLAAKVDWWFIQEGKPEQVSTVIECNPVKNEFYPFLGDGKNVDSYIDSYLASDASVLLMMGVPGSGKTSLIRYFLVRSRMKATITYEPELLESDQMFAEFMTSDDKGVLVLEDADLMLGSRDHAGNKMMSRFLNISEGLIKPKDKKIIFTTNMESTGSIDSALVRPGRCFDAVMFRPLTIPEAIKAADAASIYFDETSYHEDTITLAQLFNNSGSNSKVKKQKFGFA